MVRPLRAVLALAVIIPIAIASGCGSSSSDSAGATTTSAPPAATAAPPATAPATTPAPVAAGDAVAGETVFANSCTSCHLNNGNDAGGVGPKLAAAGLDEARVENQVINGGGPMPAGLVSGADLDNVVAYVVSIQ
jgi:cytochrome c551